MVDLAPILPVLLLGLALALAPLAWIAWRHRGAPFGAKARALTALTLFLTFDLVLFGAYTRLSDSGLGCPDWPGCYGTASPANARQEIGAAEQALPTGAVTQRKAWIEMTHRYLATGVGVLISALAVAAWVEARRDVTALSPWWATLTWFWVCLQGAFGALTVTMKLYPAIVTAHLLGGIGLLALLSAQVQGPKRRTLPLPAGLHAGVCAVAALGVLQIALGGWVSSNYAVLACRDFPTCQGTWWPPMDFEHGFAWARELGAGKDGGYLPFAALTAIHVAHRGVAFVLFAALGLLAWRLRARPEPALRRFAAALAGVAVWQLASGLGNVLFGWPLVAALAHTGGAAALACLFAALLMRARRVAPARTRAGAAGRPARATP